MNADYIKQVVDKANELIALIESAAANPALSEDSFDMWKESKANALERVREGVSFAVDAETLN